MQNKTDNKVSKVESALEDLRHAVVRNGVLIEQLRDRLGPVLNVETTDPEGTAPEPHDSVPLVRDIDNISKEVRLANVVMGRMLELLAL